MSNVKNPRTSDSCRGLIIIYFKIRVSCSFPLIRRWSLDLNAKALKTTMIMLLTFSSSSSMFVNDSLRHEDRAYVDTYQGYVNMVSLKIYTYIAYCSSGD